MNDTGEDRPADRLDDAVRAMLKSQYHAALAMFRDAVVRCPNATWLDTSQRNAFWQIAYHTLFFTDLYLQRDQTSFRGWPGHQANVQQPDGIGGPPEPGSKLPVTPQPYSKNDVLQYWDVCSRMVDEAVDGLDLHNPESGFSWYQMPKLEHQIVNIRHIQHHGAQLADRLRAAADVGVRRVGKARAPGT